MPPRKRVKRLPVVAIAPQDSTSLDEDEQPQPAGTAKGTALRGACPPILLPRPAQPPLVVDPSAVELYESLLRIVNQLAQLPDARYGPAPAQPEQDGAFSFTLEHQPVEDALSPGDEPSSPRQLAEPAPRPARLRLRGLRSRWPGLASAGSEARARVADKIARRQHDMQGLEQEAAALCLRMDASSDDQEAELCKQLYALRRMIGQHKQVLQALCSQVNVDVEVEAEHVSSCLEISRGPDLAQVIREKKILPRLQPEPQALYVFGGFGGDHGQRALLDTVHFYPGAMSPPLARASGLGWKEASCRLLTSRSHAACASVDGVLYVLGGVGPDNRPVPTMERLYTSPLARVGGGCSAGFDRADSLPSTLGLLGAVAAAVEDHSLLVAGGIARGAITPNVARYDCATNRWENLQPMTYARAYPGGAVLGVGSQARFFVIGGKGPGDHVLESVECYNPTTQRWSPVAALRNPRWGCSAAVLEGHGVYAIAGRDLAGRVMSTVERYDPANDSWQEVAPLLEAREDACAAVLGGLIYVLGGANARGVPLASVECYDPQSNAWHSCPNLPLARALANCAVTGGLLPPVPLARTRGLQVREGQE